MVVAGDARRPRGNFGGMGVAHGMWGSIRTGDINKDGKQEVLALDGTALQAWSYNPTERSWNRLRPTTPLALAADPWLTHPEYYSTIQTGDVDGDGRDDVVARGPFGIRTWFYDRRARRRGLGALPGRRLPGVPGPHAENSVFTALRPMAAYAGSSSTSDATSVRDAGRGDAPAPSDLDFKLLTDLPAVAACTGLPSRRPAELPGLHAAVGQRDPGRPIGRRGQHDALGDLRAYAGRAVFGDLDGMRQHRSSPRDPSCPRSGPISRCSRRPGRRRTSTRRRGGAVTFRESVASIAGCGAGGGAPEASAALWVVSELLSLMRCRPPGHSP